MNKRKIQSVLASSAFFISFPWYPHFNSVNNFWDSYRCSGRFQCHEDLKIDLGVHHNGPMFDLDDFKPGDCDQHEVVVNNRGKKSSTVAIKSKNIQNEQNLADVVSIQISENSNTIYTDTLTNFFQDSSPTPIPLSTLPPNSKTSYNINLCFNQDAKNEYQLTTTLFDLEFSSTLPHFDIPDECKRFKDKIVNKIEGTDGDDNLKGTDKSDLIIAKGGNDKINGKGGDDCIIGGDGNDKMTGGSGNDYLDGGQGWDKAKGGRGNDTCRNSEKNSSCEN